jgi:Rieske Fe-S protein
VNNDMSSNWKSPRREFLKTFTLLTASSVLAGRNWIATVLAQVGPSAAQGGVLRVKISDYPALQQVNGSVRIGTSTLVPSGGIPGCSGPAGLFYPVIINRGAGNVFYALSAECTHAGCTVPVYSSATLSMRCPGHGSQYAIDGSVIVGPATFPLISYNARFDGTDTLTVENPDWSIELTTLGVQPGSGGRFSLRFIAFRNIEYEVRFRDTLSGGDGPVNFSLTPTGPADQTFLSGIDDFVVVYVDRVATTGFYSIAMRTREV